MAIKWKHAFDYAVNFRNNSYDDGVTPPWNLAPPQNQAGNAFGKGTPILNNPNGDYSGEIVLCEASDKMSDIKYITIVNGNGGGIVIWSLYIDTTPLGVDSPEYWNLGKKQLDIVRSVKVPGRSTITFPIGHATWSSNGCRLKMWVKGVQAGNNSNTTYGRPNGGKWMAGSIILTGSDLPAPVGNLHPPTTQLLT